MALKTILTLLLCTFFFKKLINEKTAFFVGGMRTSIYTDVTVFKKHIWFLN